MRAKVFLLFLLSGLTALSINAQNLTVKGKVSARSLPPRLASLPVSSSRTLVGPTPLLNTLTGNNGIWVN